MCYKQCKRLLKDTLSSKYLIFFSLQLILIIFTTVFREYLEIELVLPQEKVQQIATVGVAHVNAFLAELRRLFLVEDLIDSIKFGTFLWVLTYLGSMFNGITLVILGKMIILLFHLALIDEFIFLSVI